jgi:hypothetical protein
VFGLNAVALLVFASLNMLAVRLCKCERQAAMRAIRGLSIALLTFSVCRYMLFPFTGRGVRIPVEYSTVAYFAVPIILLSGRSMLLSWATYSSMMAGFFYYLTMVAAGGPIYNVYPPFDIYISMFCHGTLYLCGSVMIGRQKCKPSDGYKLFIGTALIAVNALLLRPFVEGTERIFIYELLDGAYIRQLLPQSVWPAALPGYYIAMFGLVFLSIKWFFRLNRLQYHKYALLQEEQTEPIPVY